MKTVVILSGGIDSATVLGLVINTEDRVETLTFNYGSKHNCEEIKSAGELADFYGVPNKVIELPFIGKLFRSDLLISGRAIPEDDYKRETLKKTVVPFRNGIMLSIAVGYAESIGFDRVVIGVHLGDHELYPDCGEVFTKAFAKASEVGTYKGIRVYSPFLHKSKVDIVKIGDSLDVPYELTYSCYKGGEKHCGKCSTCRERKKAFTEAMVYDPTEYKEWLC